MTILIYFDELYLYLTFKKIIFSECSWLRYYIFFNYVAFSSPSVQVQVKVLQRILTDRFNEFNSLAQTYQPKPLHPACYKSKSRKTSLFKVCHFLYANSVFQRGIFSIYFTRRICLKEKSLELENTKSLKDHIGTIFQDVTMKIYSLLFFHDVITSKQH